MQRLFSMFPDGWPGFGLVLLRVGVAGAAIAASIHLLAGDVPLHAKGWILACFGLLVGTALLLGVVTPIAATAAFIADLVRMTTLLMAGMNDPIETLSALKWLLVSGALALLGPGAFSIDATLFSRREIIIPKTNAGRTDL